MRGWASKLGCCPLGSTAQARPPPRSQRDHPILSAAHGQPDRISFSLDSLGCERRCSRSIRDFATNQQRQLSPQHRAAAPRESAASQESAGSETRTSARRVEYSRASFNTRRSRCATGARADARSLSASLRSATNRDGRTSAHRVDRFAVQVDHHGLGPDQNALGTATVAP